MFKSMSGTRSKNWFGKKPAKNSSPTQCNLHFECDCNQSSSSSTATTGSNPSVSRITSSPTRAERHARAILQCSIEAERHRICTALIKSFHSTHLETVTYFYLAQFAGHGPADVFLEFHLGMCKLYKRLKQRADTGVDDCVIHGGKGCFCWRFEFEGYGRLYDVKNGWDKRREFDFAAME